MAKSNGYSTTLKNGNNNYEKNSAEHLAEFRQDLARKDDTKLRHRVTAEHVSLLATVQCTENEAAAAFGISSDVFAKYWLRKPAIRAAWNNGRGLGKISLRRQQWRLAMGGNVAMLIHLGKQYLDQSEKINFQIDFNTATDAELDAFVKQAQSALAALEARAAFGLDPQLAGDQTATRH